MTLIINETIVKHDHDTSLLLRKNNFVYLYTHVCILIVMFHDYIVKMPFVDSRIKPILRNFQ